MKNVRLLWCISRSAGDRKPNQVKMKRQCRLVRDSWKAIMYQSRDEELLLPVHRIPENGHSVDLVVMCAVRE